MAMRPRHVWRARWARWLIPAALLVGSGAGCSRCVRQVTSAEPAETAIAHRDGFGYQRMSTRYRTAHSLEDFQSRFRAMPHLSKAKGQIAVFGSDVSNDGKRGHVKGKVDEPGFEDITWEADVVNEINERNEDQWRCDAITIDGVSIR